MNQHRLLLATLLALMLLLLLPLPYSGLLWQQAGRLAHFLLFLVAGLVALDWLRRARTLTFANRALLVLFLSVLGAALELAQTGMARDASVEDLLMNSAGILTALVLHDSMGMARQTAWRTAWRSAWYSRLAVTFVLLSIGLLLYPVLLTGMAYVQRDRAFPVVFSADSAWTARLSRFKHSHIQMATQETALAGANGHGRDDRGEGMQADMKADMQANMQVSGKAGQHAGQYARLHVLAFQPGVTASIELFEPVADWRGYETLEFEIILLNPVSAHINLRVHDSGHNHAYDDRFNAELLLEPGLNRFKLPLVQIKNAPTGRQLDMSAINSIIFFTIDSRQPVRVWLGDVMLSR